MKILLINPTIREHHPPYNFPAGLGIIAAIMLREGHDVHVYDQNALRVSNADMCRDLRKTKNIDVIGIGGLITTYGHLKCLIPGLQEIFPNAKIVLGGGVTIEPDVIFEHMPVDFCVHGEGEHTFRELCAAIERQERDFSRIAGISYVDKDKVLKTSPRPIERDLDQFPMPAYDLFPAEIYFSNNTIKNQVGIHCGTQRCATLLWSRGCPNQCTFCWRMMGKTVRFRSVDLVMEEIAFLRSRYGVDSYLFFDECINASRKRSMEFATQLIERGYAAPWYSHARVTNFDEELASVFRRSGCVGLNFGIESGSTQMLVAMKKNVTPEQASKAVAIAQQANIRPVCTFIVGMPGETQATIRESARWIRRNRVRDYPLFFATPYPGCELYYMPLVQKRIEEKYVTKDGFFSALGDASDLSVNMTDFTDSELLRLREWAIREASRPGWLRRAYLFIGRLCRLLRQPSRWGTVLRNRMKSLWQIAVSSRRILSG